MCEPDEVDRAVEVVGARLANGHGNHHDPGWWERWSGVLAFITNAVLALAVILLASVAFRLVNAQDRQNDVDRCAEAIDAEVDHAAQRTRAAAAALNAVGWTALLTFAPDAPPDEPIDAQAIRHAIAEAEAAANADNAAVMVRTDWLDAGRPLPCPAQPS